MKFDRGIFFEQYRRHFGEIREQYQVDGLNRLLTGFETYYGWWDDVRQIANAFAQVGWETAWSYNPVEEGYYLGDADEPGYFDGENSAAVKRLQKSFRYFPHFGRGDIQLTWAENYADQDGRIRKYFPERVADFERRTGKRFDLIRDPDQALDGWISFCIFTLGMHLGTFRPGRNLDRYITPTSCDHFNARDIVNGDKNYVKQGKKIGNHIAETAARFQAILKAAIVTDTIDDTIDRLGDGVGIASPPTANIDPAGSQFGSPQTSALFPVEPPAGQGTGVSMPEPFPAVTDQAPGETTLTQSTQSPDGTQKLEASVTTPAGDPPGAPPSHWFSVEDWKPLVFRWLKRTWATIVPANIAQGSTLTFAAINDMPNWYVYAAIAAVIFLVLVGAGLIVSAILLVVWLWNRREILHMKAAEFVAKADPNMKNVGLNFERK